MTVPSESELIHEDFQRVIKGFLRCLTHNVSLRVPASKRNEKDDNTRKWHCQHRYGKIYSQIGTGQGCILWTICTIKTKKLYVNE